ncbi:PAS domain S-box protein [Xylophilus rhododendri]|uniref:histidine kinase n=1 Tax=Xylophilus rhododendri TaxID=2697032 RepID=A0A857J2E7_9BURK|nr:PAS domain-containing sensor histidine kinase [Xylophilus rhododendri]QHI98094.1 PAS domain S-box protein [Xylophilus rhododendri]
MSAFVPPRPTPAPDGLPGAEALIAGGETGQRLRAFDWSAHALGPPARWPAALRTAVNLILSVPESIYICWGPALHFFHNDPYVPMLGPRLGQSIGTTLPRLWPDAWEAVRPDVEAALAGGTVQHVDVPIAMARHGVPEQTWWTYSFSPLRDETGAVAGVFCITNEQTERILSLQARELGERRLDVAQATGLLGFFEWDVRSAMARGDANFARAYGFAPEEAERGIALRAIVDRADPEHRDSYAASVAASAARADDYEREVKVRRPDGSVRWLMVRARCAASGPDGPLVFTGIVVDITAAKNAEELLRRANESLELRVAQRTRERDRAWNLSRDLMGVADTEGVWISVNPAWERLLGWRPEQIVGRTSHWLIHPDDQERTRQEERSLAAGTVTERFVNRFCDTQARYHWLSWTAVMEGGLLYCSARDVTEATEHQAQLEHTRDALRQAQKMEAIGQLTGGVAHDFNNLLTVIRSSVDLLRHPRMNEDRRGRYLEAISDTVDRASRLTGQLLAFARRQALQPEVFEVNQRVRSVAEMIRTMVGSLVRLEVRCTPQPLHTHADTSQFDTALVNLAVNARDAMQGQGELHIEVRRTDAIPAQGAHPAVSGDFVVVHVADEGHGMAPELMDKIFEPFFTTKPVGKGTGLGLSQVFGFVQQSGGQTRVRSAPGEGTRLSLYLPAVAAPPAAPVAVLAAREVAPAPAREGLLVLLVEDNEEVGPFAEQVLQALGYRTRWATHAEQALEWLAEPGERIDAVLTDVMMPGISGVELAQRLRVSHPGLPVVLTSGYSHVLAQDGGHGFTLVQKPYSVETLGAALERVLEHGRA